VLPSGSTHPATRTTARLRAACRKKKPLLKTMEHGRPLAYGRVPPVRPHDHPQFALEGRPGCQLVAERSRVGVTGQRLLDTSGYQLPVVGTAAIAIHF